MILSYKNLTKDTMKKDLGQYMTPNEITNLIAQEVGQCDIAIDFAVGTGELLKAVQKTNKTAELIGFDIDNSVLNLARKDLKNQTLIHGNGLSKRLPKINPTKKIVVVGNPPYLSNKNEISHNWSSQILRELKSLQGLDRLEIQFLCRSIATAEKFKGKVVIIMPISFADGDKYAAIRGLIMKNYHIEKCIELPSYTFKDTEARTVILVINTTNIMSDKVTAIGIYHKESKNYKIITKKHLEPETRLDARFYSVPSKQKTDILLSDVNVSISRGLLTKKHASEMKIQVIHTSDLTRLKNMQGKIDNNLSERHQSLPPNLITIQTGDIILARTGKRVCWEPIIISSGKATITDHVFRIRIPEDIREIVQKSFFHPKFSEWLNANCKGVCSTVLTKRELMQMPLFALNN